MARPWKSARQRKREAHANDAAWAADYLVNDLDATHRAEDRDDRVGPLGPEPLERRRYRTVLNRMQREYPMALSREVRDLGHSVADRELAWLRDFPEDTENAATMIRARCAVTRGLDKSLFRLDHRYVRVSLWNYQFQHVKTSVVATALLTQGRDFRVFLLGVFALDIRPREFTYSLKVQLGNMREKIAVPDCEPLWAVRASAPGGKTLEDFFFDDAVEFHVEESGPSDVGCREQTAAEFLSSPGPSSRRSR